MAGHCQKHLYKCMNNMHHLKWNDDIICDGQAKRVPLPVLLYRRKLHIVLDHVRERERETGRAEFCMVIAK